MRVHCSGVGSIGSLVAFHLRRANPVPAHDFTLLVRKGGTKSKRPQTNLPFDPTYVYVESGGVRRRIGGFDVERTNPAWDAVLNVPLGQQGSSSLPSRNNSSGPDTSIIRSLIVTSKASHTLPTLTALQSRLDAGSTVFLLQNGMGVHEHLISTLFTNPEKRPNFIIGSTTHAVWLKRPNDVVHAGMGDIQFAIAPDPDKGRDFDTPFIEAMRNNTTRAPGVQSPQHPLISSLISPAHEQADDPRYYTLAETTRMFLRAQQDLHTSWVPMAEMDVILRRKLVVNAAIGPLTSLTDAQNGALYGNDSAQRLIRSICQEASAVFAREAEELQQAASHDGRAGVSDSWATSLTRRGLEQAVSTVIRKTSRNFSSMLVDVRHGNLTEIEYINGHIVRLGKRLGVPTPTNAMLAEVIRLKHSIPTQQLATL